MELKSHTVENNKITVLELQGRFDAYEAPLVKQWLDETINATSAQIIVNLSGVNFIDSTALSTLVQGMKHCREKDGDLHLCQLQQPVQIIFELTRLDKAFAIFSDQAEAVAAFNV